MKKSPDILLFMNGKERSSYVWFGFFLYEHVNTRYFYLEYLIGDILVSGYFSFEIFRPVYFSFEIFWLEYYVMKPKKPVALFTKLCNIATIIICHSSNGVILTSI